MQTSWTARRRNTVRRQRKILCFEWCVGFEAKGVTAIAQVNSRAPASANRTAQQSVLLEVNDTKVFAVAAVLPLKMNCRVAFAMLSREIKLTEDVASVLALDWALSRRKEAALVFVTEYSHRRCSL